MEQDAITPKPPLRGARDILCSHSDSVVLSGILDNTCSFTSGSAQ